MQELREPPLEFLIKRNHEFVISRNCINLKIFQNRIYIYTYFMIYTKIFDLYPEKIFLFFLSSSRFSR